MPPVQITLSTYASARALKSPAAATRGLCAARSSPYLLAMSQMQPLARPALAAALCAALALPVAAQSPLTAEAFDRFTQGKTLYYFNNGQPYGVERYLPDRRVIWSFLDGECQDGTWYESPPYICFEYDTGLGPQCWQFFLENGQLRAVFEDGTQGATPYVADEAPQEMVCLGPRIGV